MNETQIMNDTVNGSQSVTGFSMAEIVSIGTVLSIIIAATIIGNFLVLLSFYLDKKLRTHNNYFLFSLAVADILTGGFSMPMFGQFVLVGDWRLGSKLCDMWLAQDYVCGSASSLHLLVIGFDRYMSVTRPLRYRARRTSKRVLLMIGCVWATAFILWPPWIYAWQNDSEGRRIIPDDNCYIQLLENFYATFFTALIDYYVPLAIMLFLYYKIWKETRRRKKFKACLDSGNYNECMSRNLAKKEGKACLPCHFVSSKDEVLKQVPNSIEAIKDAGTALLDPAAESSRENTLENELSNGEEEEDALGAPDLNAVSSPNNVAKATTKKINSKNEKKAVRVLTTILVAYVACTIPYNVTVIIRNLDSTDSLVSETLWNWFYFMFYFNSTLNPICYALANKNFRRTYWRILSFSWNKSTNSDYSGNNYSDKSLPSIQNVVKNATSV